MRIESPNAFFRAALVLLGAAIVLIQYGHASAAINDQESLDYGFSQMYNLDFAAAHKTFELWQQRHPDDPMGAASHAAAYLFAEFERLHILQLDLFTGERGPRDQGETAPDPGTKLAFESELAKSDGLAAKILAEKSDDRNALFAKTLADGLRADYAALVDHRKGSGLEFLKSSRVTADKLISIDSEYYDAYLAIGIENYVLSLRSAPARWALRLSGAQTSKDKGLTNLRITAEKGRYLAPYARLLLAIAALRERDRDTARKLLATLAEEFPHNRLYRVELARLRS